MKLRQATSLAILALASVGVTGLTGCGALLGIEERTKNTQGRCEGTLHLRVLGDESSAVKDVGIPVTAAIFDTVAWINGNGGVRGCQVDYEYADSGYNKPKSTQAYNTWKAGAAWSQVSAILAFGTDPLQAIGQPASDDKQVVVGASYNGDCAAPVRTGYDVSVPDIDATTFVESSLPESVGSVGYPYVFFQGTDYSTAARLAMRFIAQQRGKRVGFFACTESDYCTAPVKAAKVYVKTELPDVALGRTLELSLSGTQTAYDAAVLAYFEQEVAHKAADASYQMVDWVWFGNTRTTAVYAAKAIAAAVATIRQTTPDFEVKVMANNWAVDEVFMDDAYDETQGRWWGMQSFLYYADLSASGMQLVHQVQDTYRRETGFPAGPVAHFRNIEYVYGYSAVLAWKTAAEKLIDAEGTIAAEDVRGEALKNTFDTFQDVFLDGLTTSRIRYTSTDHRPQDSVAVYHIEGDAPIFVSTIQVSLKDEWRGW